MNFEICKFLLIGLAVIGCMADTATWDGATTLASGASGTLGNPDAWQWAARTSDGVNGAQVIAQADAPVGASICINQCVQSGATVTSPSTQIPRVSIWIPAADVANFEPGVPGQQVQVNVWCSRSMSLAIIEQRGCSGFDTATALGTGACSTVRSTDVSCDENSSNNPFTTTLTTSSASLVLVLAQKTAGSPQAGDYFVVDDWLIGGNSGVFGDPHFMPLIEEPQVGYLPTSSRPVAVYNHITHPEFQYNAEWKFYSDHPTAHTEVVTEMGFIFKSGGRTCTVKLSPEPDTSPNSNWTTTGAMDIFMGQGRGRLFKSPRIESKCGSMQVTRLSPRRVIIESDIFEFEISLNYVTPYMTKKGRGQPGTRPGDLNNWPFFNLDVTSMDREKASIAHGLLGQTARPEIPYREPTAKELKRKNCFECYVKGTIDDYWLKSGDLFGTDFKYNLFEF